MPDQSNCDLTTVFDYLVMPELQFVWLGYKYVQQPKETPYVLHVFHVTLKNHPYLDFEYKLKTVPFPSCLMLYLTNNYLMHSYS